jgi:hypothetical protein
MAVGVSEFLEVAGRWLMAARRWTEQSNCKLLCGLSAKLLCGFSAKLLCGFSATFYVASPQTFMNKIGAMALPLGRAGLATLHRGCPGRWAFLPKTSAFLRGLSAILRGFPQPSMWLIRKLLGGLSANSQFDRRYLWLLRTRTSMTQRGGWWGAWQFSKLCFGSIVN